MTLPLPKPVLLLSALSVLFCIIIFALGLVNYASFSVWINTITASLTILYHALTFVKAWRRQRLDPNSSEQSTFWHSTASSAWAFILCAIWVVTLAMTAAVVIMGPSSVTVNVRNAAWNITVQLADALVVAMELIVLGSIAVWSVVTRKRINFETQDADEKFFYSGSLSRTATIESVIYRTQTVERPLPTPDVTPVPIAKPPQTHRYDRRTPN